ncbi:MAG: hypothetical protein K6E37_08035 [Bacteroidales bacterium]|nr:hypothetical protein [Bacteroidales bacterium]
MKLMLLLSMFMSLFGCTSWENDNEGRKPEGAFMYYEYRSTTMREYPHEYWRLENTKESGLTLSWAKCNSDITVLRVPEEAVQKLTDLVNQYKLYKLKSSYKPPFDVRDGIMWHVYIRYEKSDTYSSADNAWPPKALWSGIEAINAYLDTLISASTESDILEIKKNR